MNSREDFRRIALSRASKTPYEISHTGQHKVLDSCPLVLEFVDPAELRPETVETCAYEGIPDSYRLGQTRLLVAKERVLTLGKGSKVASRNDVVTSLLGGLVHVVATTSPKVGVEFIGAFLEHHAGQIRERQREIQQGSNKDAYLLILTPAGEMKFLTDRARDSLLAAVNEFGGTSARPGADYWRVRDYYNAARRPSQNFYVRKVLAHEGVEPAIICDLLQRALATEKDFIEMDDAVIRGCLEKAEQIRAALENIESAPEQCEALRALIRVADPVTLASDLESHPVGGTDGDGYDPVELQQDPTAAVQVTTIVGSKGLSADHVIVLGCDNANLQYISRSAFFVALTRAKESLTVLACIGGGGAKTLHAFLSALPDEHTRALYAKANGQVEYETIAELQDKLEKWEYAKKMRAKKKAKKP